MDIKDITRKELENFYIKENKKKADLIENIFYGLNSLVESINGLLIKNRIPFSLNINVKEKEMDFILGRDSQSNITLPKSD